MYKSPQESMALFLEQSIRQMSGFFQQKKLNEQSQTFQAEQAQLDRQQNSLDRQQNQRQFQAGLQAQSDAQNKNVLYGEIQKLQASMASLDKNDPAYANYEKALGALQGGLSLSGPALQQFLGGGAKVPTSQTQQYQGQGASFDVVSPSLDPTADFVGQGTSQNLGTITATPTVEITQPVQQDAFSLVAQAGQGARVAEDQRVKEAKVFDAELKSKELAEVWGYQNASEQEARDFSAMQSNLDRMATSRNLEYSTLAQMQQQMVQNGFASDQNDADRKLQQYLAEKGFDINEKQFSENINLQRESMDRTEAMTKLGWDENRYERKISQLEVLASNVANANLPQEQKDAALLNLKTEAQKLQDLGILKSGDPEYLRTLAGQADPLVTAQIASLQAGTDKTLTELDAYKTMLPFYQSTEVAGGLDEAIKAGDINRVRGLKVLAEKGLLPEGALPEGYDFDTAISEAQTKYNADRTMLQSQLALAEQAIEEGDLSNAKAAGELGLSMSSAFNSTEEWEAWMQENFSQKELKKLEDSGSLDFMRTQVKTGINLKTEEEQVAAISYLAASIPEGESPEWDSAWAELVQERFGDNPAMQSAYMTVASGLKDQSTYAYSKLKLDLLQSEASIENTKASTSLMRANEAQTWAQTGKINAEVSMLSSGPLGPDFDDAIKSLELQRDLSDDMWESSGCGTAVDGMMPESGVDGKSCSTYYAPMRNQQLAEIDSVRGQLLRGSLPPNASTDTLLFTSQYPEFQGDPGIAREAFQSYLSDPANFDPSPYREQLSKISEAQQEESAAAFNATIHNKEVDPNSAWYKFTELWQWVPGLKEDSPADVVRDYVVDAYGDIKTGAGTMIGKWSLEQLFPNSPNALPQSMSPGQVELLKNLSESNKDKSLSEVQSLVSNLVSSPTWNASNPSGPVTSKSSVPGSSSAWASEPVIVNGKAMNMKQLLPSWQGEMTPAQLTYATRVANSNPYASEAELRSFIISGLNNGDWNTNMSTPMSSSAGIPDMADPGVSTQSALNALSQMTSAQPLGGTTTPSAKQRQDAKSYLDQLGIRYDPNKVSNNGVDPSYAYQLVRNVAGR
jgi:predicted transcriptional regulator